MLWVMASKRAVSIAREALRSRNPDDGDPAATAGFRIGNALQEKGVDVSSASEDDYVEVLEEAGIEEDDALIALEDLAAFGVTDTSIRKARR